LAKLITNDKHSKLLKKFNASLFFDKELYAQDIRGSIAHANMLCTQKIINNKELNLIKKGLLQIKSEIEDNKFHFTIEDEDIHMAIESRLIDIIGDSGKKLHTARSRNDQIALDFRMYCLEKQNEISLLLKKLISSLLDISSKHTKTILPGMTHLQHAQPINFAFHLLAYVSMFKRDVERCISSNKRNNISPIGCAALAGTGYNIDREMTAKELRFSSVSINCLDTVSDRDFALELLFNISTMSMHISRLCEELVNWSSYEFRFIKISDEFSTGSSIMPQKRNPDIPELLRAKTGRVNGNLLALFTVMKSLPLAYNKDTQEDKEGVFDSVKTALDSLEILNALMNNITINKDKMKEATNIGHLSSTDLADFLVNSDGLAFRDAYHIIKKVVKYADSKNIDISQMNLKQLREVYPDMKKEALSHLSLEGSMNKRTSQGGTASKECEKQIEYFKNWLKEE
jgi:argininosuccinate lyase